MTSLILFWTSLLLLLYVYVGYGILVRFAARFFGKPVKAADVWPTVTVVVAAYNEQAHISEKLDNLLSLQYPADRLNILVASDGSTDNTDAIVTHYGSPRVSLLRVEGRVGKTACQNAAVVKATGEVVVFTDATTVIDGHAVEAMTRNFADPTVGCVAAQLVYVGKGRNLTALGGTAYWSYEMGLRTAESALGSLIGVSGCLYAVRRLAYRPIRDDLISDFVIAMNMREQNLRTVLEPKAICFEETLDRSTLELSMRVRVAIRSIAALVSERRLLNPVRYGLFSIQLLSHKLLRYASPFIWAILLLASALLSRHPFYLAMLLLQVGLLATGAAGFFLKSLNRDPGVLGKPFYFLLTNVASLIAVFRYLRGERVRIWSPLRS